VVELIKNLEEALDEMAKVGNQKGIDILEKALRQANTIHFRPEDCKSLSHSQQTTY